MQAIIPVGGEGKRLASVTQGQPKALLDVGGSTLIEQTLQRALELGSSQLVLVVRDNSFRARFGQQYQGAGIEYVIQPENAQGLGQAVRCGAVSVATESHFLVMCADVWRSHAFSANLHQRFQSGEEMLNLVTDCPPEKLRHSAAVYSNQSGRIERIVEKPTRADTRWAESGVYRFPDALLQAPVQLQSNGEETLQSMVQWLIDQGWPCQAVKDSGQWINVNTPEDLERARRLAAAQLHSD